MPASIAKDIYFATAATERFETVSLELRARLAARGAARPDFARRMGQFYCLEAFRLRGYRKVLYKAMGCGPLRHCIE